VLDSDSVLAGAIWRNIFEMNCVDVSQLELMVEYVRRQVLRFLLFSLTWLATLRQLYRSAWVGRSNCLFVFVFICLQHNSKMNNLKVFKLGIGNDLGMT